MAALVAEISKGRFNGKGDYLFEQRIEWVESWNGFIPFKIYDTSTSEAVRRTSREAWWKRQRKRHAALVREGRLRGLTATATALEVSAGVVQAWVVQNVTFPRYCSGMGLGDSPCTLLVFPWLGEVVGASLAMG